MSEVEKTTKKQLGGVTGKGFMPGKSGNPKGRPKRGWSIKDKFWKKFENQPEELENFMLHLMETQPGVVWQMLEGRPHQTQDINAEIKTPVPLDPDIKNEDKDA